MSEPIAALTRLGSAAKKLRKAIGKDGLPEGVNPQEFAQSLDHFARFMDEVRAGIKNGGPKTDTGR